LPESHPKKQINDMDGLAESDPTAAIYGNFRSLRWKCQLGTVAHSKNRYSCR
jgi:hypothetical protein